MEYHRALFLDCWFSSLSQRSSIFFQDIKINYNLSFKILTYSLSHKPSKIDDLALKLPKLSINNQEIKRERTEKDSQSTEACPQNGV